MRTLTTILVILGTPLLLAACRPADQTSQATAHAEGAMPESPPEKPACGLVGAPAEKVIVDQMPATANAPFTVKTTPAVPAFHLSADPASGLRFVRTPPNSGDRWERVAVANFREATTEAPLPPGSLSGPCSDLTGPNEPKADQCRVTFPANMEPCTLFKYDILLYLESGDTEPDLGIDPVGIIK